MEGNLNSLKIKLEKLITETKRRNKNNKLLRYNSGKKVHKKQLEFHKCKKKNRWVFGGNRTGKTECGAVETVWLLRGIHPFKENKPNVSGWAVSLSREVQRDVAQSKILNYLNPDWISDIVMQSGKKDSPSSGVIDKIYIKNVFGGISVLGFKSCDQGREKFQGTSLDFVWFDEEPPEDIYLECRMRVLDRCGEVFGTMTPLKGLTWVYNNIYLNEKNDPDVWCEHISWSDNPFLNQDEIKKLKSTMSSEELDARCNGNFSDFGGLVYNNFTEENIIEPFNVPKDWFDNVSIDPGYKNPLSCHFYACDYDGNVYVIAEHYGANKTIEEHSRAILNIAKNLGWDLGFNGKLNAIIDSAGLQKTLSSPKSVVELFYDNGINASPKVNKDLFSGIQRVRNYICDCNGNRKLFIFKNCVNLIREIKGYFWGNDESPVKKDDHALDELRYYIMNRPENAKRSKSETLNYKDKLIRKLNRTRREHFLK